MVKIAVCGAAGRMGTSILRLAKNDPALAVVGALERKDSPAVGTGEPKITADLAGAVSAADVVIDFTTPAATLEHLEAVLAKGKAMVIGTTGFSAVETERIAAAAKKIPVVFSPNYSAGVNLLFHIAGEVARILEGYDVEIVELHHNQKKDAPSGTAVRLSEIIADALHRDIEKVGVYGREGIIGPRKKEEIGVLAVRAGDIVGDHTIYYAGPGERIELTHRAQSRDPLAAGALRAAAWVVRQKAGLYTMQDVLGFEKKQ